jgi:hypothetical protein
MLATVGVATPPRDAYSQSTHTAGRPVPTKLKQGLTLVVFQLMRSVVTLISPTLTPRGTATNTAPATTHAKTNRKAAVSRVSRGCSRESAGGSGSRARFRRVKTRGRGVALGGG